MGAVGEIERGFWDCVKVEGREEEGKGGGVWEREGELCVEVRLRISCIYIHMNGPCHSLRG